MVVMTVVSQWGEQPMNIFRVSRKLCTEYRSTCIIYIRVNGIDRTSHFFSIGSSEGTSYFTVIR